MKPKGSLGDGPNKAQCTVWRELAEIFSVRFLEFEKLSLEDLYGVILAAGFYSYVIFERYFGDPLPCIDSEVSLSIFLLLFSFIKNTNIPHVVHRGRGRGERAPRFSEREM